MKVAYEEQQRMIQEQQDLLERLREEHEKVKKDTEQDLEEMRETLKREKEEGEDLTNLLILVFFGNLIMGIFFQKHADHR